MARLLLVEDNEMNRDMLSLRLRAYGFDVILAENGRIGLELAQQMLPDLILMDLNLPEVDGWEATRRLKSAPDTHDIPLIALSAHLMAEERDRAMRAGANDYDTKPVDMPRLLAKIRTLLTAPM